MEKGKTAGGMRYWDTYSCSGPQLQPQFSSICGREAQRIE